MNEEDVRATLAKSPLLEDLDPTALMFLVRLGHRRTYKRRNMRSVRVIARPFISESSTIITASRKRPNAMNIRAYTIETRIFGDRVSTSSARSKTAVMGFSTARTSPFCTDLREASGYL